MKNTATLIMFAFISCMYCAFDLSAQETNVTGNLLNSQGKPVSQAQVSLKLAGIETLSSVTGSFILYQDKTSVEIPDAAESKVSFDGRKLIFAGKGEQVYVGIFDLAGREIANVISNQTFTGTYALYPGAYLGNKSQTPLIVRAAVGEEWTSFIFVPDGQPVQNKGLFEISATASIKKTTEASYSNIDTLVISHDLYVKKKIPIDCNICSFGDITLFEIVPAAPNNLSGISESSSTIKLNWSDNSDNETGFKIEKATFQVFEWSDFTEIADIQPNSTEFTDEELMQGRSYKYRLLAYNGGGSSGYSEEITVTTQVSNPLSISGPSSSTGGFDIEVSYSWPGMLSSTNDRFDLEESSSPTEGFTKVANSPWGDRPQSYTFSLSKPSGTYYYRARASTFSGFTEYTDVISVSVNTPVQKAYLKVVNNTHYPMIDIRLNNGQMVGQDMGILQGNNFTFEFTTSGQVNYVLGVGYWSYGSRVIWFWLSGTSHVTVGTTSTLTFDNPTIGQLMSGFSFSRDWTGEYWVNLNMYMAGYRFYSNGSWTFIDNGIEKESGTVSLVSWPDNAAIVKFKLCPSCEEILLPHPFGQFKLRNGPASWPIIEYTAQ
jgi:hypothetical protein